MAAKSKKSFNNIPALLRDMPRIIETSTEAAGVQYAKRLHERIVAQDPAWEPKAESTLRSENRRTKGKAWKAGKINPGDKYKLWVDTGDLRGEIHQETQKIPAAQRRRKRNRYLLQVGVFSEDRGMAAAVLEYGNKKGTVAARPLFRPVFDERVDELQRMQVKIINRELKKYIRR